MEKLKKEFIKWIMKEQNISKEKAEELFNKELIRWSKRNFN